MYELENGRLISLPVPPYGVAYAVIENESGLTVIWCMKLPGEESVAEVLSRCKSEAPALDWEPYACAVTGSIGGSPHPFEQYFLARSGERLILDAAGCGDMVTAFQRVGETGSAGARPIPDLGEVLHSLGFGLSDEKSLYLDAQTGT
jgi:hypothetical protein